MNSAQEHAVQTAELVDVARLAPALVAATGDQRWNQFEFVSGSKPHLAPPPWAGCRLIPLLAAHHPMEATDS